VSTPRSLVTILLGVKVLGIANSLRAIRFSLSRQCSDRTYRQRLAKSSSPIGKLTKTDPVPHGWQIGFEHASLELVFLAKDLARLTWQPGRLPVPYAIEQAKWPETDVHHLPLQDGFLLSTSDLQIEVHATGQVQFLDPNNSLLHSLYPPVRSGQGWVQQASLLPGEHIYGLGLHAQGLNLRAQTHRMWATDPGGIYGPGIDPLYMPIPVFFGLHEGGSYLIFYENHCPSTFEMGSRSTYESDSARLTFEMGALRYYFIQGPFSSAIEQFSCLTGKAPLPPIWSLGYHQSRWGYKSTEDIRQVVQGFKEHRLNLSAVHLDLDYMHDRRSFTFDPDRFADIEELSADLKRDGIHLAGILDPGIKVEDGYDIYRSGLEANAYCTDPGGKTLTAVAFSGPTVFPDFTSSRVRKWWQEFYPRLLKRGLDGIWHDMNEPTAFNAWGGNHLPLNMSLDLEGTGGDHYQGHNVYGLQMNRAGYAAMKQYAPHKRPWILSRSGWAGNQRYAWNWTADSESTWAGLKLSLTATLALAFSGIPYCGPDIGGFSGDPTPELYTRWFQLAAFLPFFRTHSSLITQRREPWVFGEPYTGIIRRYINLRYQLLPYLYTLAWEASQRGYPIVRPIFFRDQDQPELWDIDDGYMLGDTLLIAPVFSVGLEKRQVSFPKGSWYSFWDDHFYQGPGNFTIPVNLENIPVFVRGGLLLPLLDRERLSLNIYPGEGNSLLYSDAGDGFGAGRVDKYKMHTIPHGYRIDWQTEGEYPFPYPDIETVLHADKLERVFVDGEQLAPLGNHFSCGIFQQADLILGKPVDDRR